MNFQHRLDAICARMHEERLALLIGLHDGAHFIEKPNPVMVLTGFKAIGASAAVLYRDGSTALIVAPRWDAERAAAACPHAKVVGADDVVEALFALIGRDWHFADDIGMAGLSFLPSGMANRVTASPRHARRADEVVFHAARIKTDREIAYAREAVRIAELGYRRLLQLAQPGISEDRLALELRWYMKTLGAEDNFLLLCGGAHNRAVAPSTGHKLAAGEIVLAEITPSVGGQLAQICRTVAIGEPPVELAAKYALVTEAMQHGIAAARPGRAVAEVCGAINAVLEAHGYGKYCRPPHIRRRGHGLGFASVRPGDVSPDNATLLEPDMLFMIHPNQYLPETGYLLCGEPVLMTPHGAQVLTHERSSLGVVSA